MVDPASLARRRRSRAANLGYLAGYLMLRLGSGMVRAIGVSAASSLTGWLLRMVGPWTRRHRRIAANLARALPDTTAAERDRIAAAQWDNLGRTLAETLGTGQMIAEPSRFHIVVAPDLDHKLRDRTAGVVFISLHMANWEVGGRTLVRYGPIAGLYQRLADPRAEAFVRSLREQVYEGGMLPKEPETVRRAMALVRSGGAVAILADLYERRGIPITFFGHTTLASPFPAMLARRLGATLVAVRPTRLRRSRFRLELEEIPVAVTGDITADVSTTTQMFFDRFETWIRGNPGQWMWVQNRWRTGSS